MNIKHLSLALIAAASATVAMADTGTITFNGLVVADTCTTTLTGGASATAVTLPTVPTTALAAANNIAGYTPFSLSVTGCDATAATRGIRYTLTPSAYASNNNLLANTSGAGFATNVGVEILEGTTPTPIQFAGAAHQTNNVNLTSGVGSVSLAAQYKATGPTPATAGTVTSVLNWTLVYN